MYKIFLNNGRHFAEQKMMGFLWAKKRPNPIKSNYVSVFKFLAYYGFSLYCIVYNIFTQYILIIKSRNVREKRAATFQNPLSKDKNHNITKHYEYLVNTFHIYN